MNANTLIGLLIVAGLAAGGGYWFGSQKAGAGDTVAAAAPGGKKLLSYRSCVLSSSPPERRNRCRRRLSSPFRHCCKSIGRRCSPPCRQHSPARFSPDTPIRAFAVASTRSGCACR